jgi:hypothetical protein
MMACRYACDAALTSTVPPAIRSCASTLAAMTLAGVYGTRGTAEGRLNQLSDQQGCAATGREISPSFVARAISQWRVGPPLLLKR